MAFPWVVSGDYLSTPPLCQAAFDAPPAARGTSTRLQLMVAVQQALGGDGLM